MQTMAQMAQMAQMAHGDRSATVSRGIGPSSAVSFLKKRRNARKWNSGLGRLSSLGFRLERYCDITILWRRIKRFGFLVERYF